MAVSFLLQNRLFKEIIIVHFFVISNNTGDNFSIIIFIRKRIYSGFTYRAVDRIKKPQRSFTRTLYDDIIGLNWLMSRIPEPISATLSNSAFRHEGCFDYADANRGTSGAAMRRSARTTGLSGQRIPAHLQIP